MLLPIDTFAALFLLLYSSQKISVTGGQAPSFLLANLFLLAGVVTVGLANAVVAGLVNRRMNRERSRGGVHGGSIAASVFMLSRIFTVVVFIPVVLFAKWPASFASGVGMPSSALVMNLVGVLPFVLLSFAAWLPLYRLHLQSSPGNWTLGSYLLHKFRYSFFILGMWIPVSFIEDAMSGGKAGELLDGNLAQALTYGVLFLMVWFFPAFLRVFWGCRKLPEGKLRERVHELERAAGVRFSQIYLWDLGGGALPNAAAVGLFAPFKYLFLSRALVEKLNAEEIDGVVCHEMGHVKHRHLLVYFVLMISFMHFVMGLLSDFLGGMDGLFQVAAVVVALTFFVRVVFAVFSRRMERQADLFALETMGDSKPLCRALERLSMVSHTPRGAPSWHHMGIGERVAFLRAAEVNPQLVAMHHRQVTFSKLLILAFAFSVFLPSLTDLHNGVSTSGGEFVTQKESLIDQQIEHWRAVREMVPGGQLPNIYLAKLELERKGAGGKGLEQAERYLDSVDPSGLSDFELKLYDIVRKRVDKEKNSVKTGREQ